MEVLGVSIAVFRTVLARIPAEKVSSFTTQDVCDEIVKPAASGKFLSSALVDAKHEVGPASVFVSHAWKYVFADVADVVEQYEKEHAGSFYWFDLFVNDQHTANQAEYTWWTSTFKNSIRSIGKVLAVMSPWNSPVPLTRAWCLWELLCAVTENTELSILLPTSQIAAFKEGIAKNALSVTDALVQADLRKATSCQPSDQYNIFLAIEASPGGFEGLSRTIKDYLREWYSMQVIHFGQQNALEPDSLKRAEFYNNVARVLNNNFNKYSTAIQYYEFALAAHTQREPPDQKSIATLLNNIGTVYIAMFQIQRGLDYFNWSLEIKLKEYGPEATTIATSYINIGLQYHWLCKYDAAIEAYIKALGIYSTQSEMTPTIKLSIATAHHNHALSLHAMGEFSTSIALYHKSLGLYIEACGPDHPRTAASYHNLGNVYRDSGDLDKGMEYLQKSLTIRLDCVGPRHADTASSIHNIGHCFFLRGDLAIALENLTRALDLRLELHSRKHPNVAHTYLCRGHVYLAQKALDKALHDFSECFKIRDMTIGETHPDYYQACFCLGLAYIYLGDSDLAKPYFGKCILNHKDCSSHSMSLDFGPSDTTASKKEISTLEIEGSESVEHLGLKVAHNYYHSSLICFKHIIYQEGNVGRLLQACTLSTKNSLDAQKSKPSDLSLNLLS